MSFLSFTVCAHCGQAHEMASAVCDKKVKKEPRPDDGDKSLCFRCGQWNVFDEGEFGGLRKATAAEVKRLNRSKVGRRLVAAWRLVDGRRLVS